MKKETFLKLRLDLISEGYGDEIQWAEDIKPCDTAGDFFSEYMWVVLSSGMKNQIARLIEERIYKDCQLKIDTITAFRNQSKVRAIDYVKKNKVSIYKLSKKLNKKRTWSTECYRYGQIKRI